MTHTPHAFIIYASKFFSQNLRTPPSLRWDLVDVRGQRFDLRFFRPFRADLSIKKSSSLFPPLIAATSQRGLAPRPAHVSPEGLRYFGGTFFPFNALPRSRPPTTAMALPIFTNCRSMSERRLREYPSLFGGHDVDAVSEVDQRTHEYGDLFQEQGNWN